MSVNWKSGSQDTFLFSKHPRTSAQTSIAVGEPAACDAQQRETGSGTVSAGQNGSPWAASWACVRRRDGPRHRREPHTVTTYRVTLGPLTEARVMGTQVLE